MNRRRTALVLLLLAASAAVVTAQDDQVPAGDKGAVATEEQAAATGAASEAPAQAPATSPNAGAHGTKRDAKENSQQAIEQEASAAEEVAEAAGEAGAVTARTVEELERAVEAAAAMQMLGERSKVVNALIQQAPPAELANGDGDVSTTGACKASIKSLCHAVKPGAGRLVLCLSHHSLAATLAEARGIARLGRDGEQLDEISEACRKEMEKFKIDAAGNINRNVPVAMYCKRAVEQFCSTVTTEDEGGVLHCLRKQRRRLRGRCQALVFSLEQAASDDLRLDFKLFKACAADSSRLCPNVDFKRGAMQECLLEQEGSLDWQCKAELFRQELEESDDIRLSLRLMRTCMEEKGKFCEGVAPGEASVKDCLEAHLFEPGFGEECREHMQSLIQERSFNFRLDSIIRSNCGADVARLCGLDRGLFEGADLLGGPQPLTVSEESVSKCLQDNRDSIQDEVCATRVRRVIAATLRDISFNHPLAEACGVDRERLCGKIPQGSAGVVRCLAAKREQLDPGCAAMLFDTEVAMAESIDFNWPLKEACGKEVQKFCKGVPRGHGRVLRCLETAAAEHPDGFSEGCRAGVAAYEERAAQDYRLNSRLAAACKGEVERSCPDVCGKQARRTGCGGSVLHCLSDLVDDQQAVGPQCRAELKYYQKMQVRAFGNDASLAEACRGDVESLCGDEDAGAVLGCLHKNRRRLSPACKREEARMEQMQAESIDLHPSIASACRDEWAAHCSSLRSGNSQVLNCLLSQAATSPDFSPLCIEVLDGLQERRLRDWRTDYQLRAACQQDVRSLCADFNTAVAESTLEGGTFKCLVEAATQLSSDCAAEVGRAARTALDFYKEGLPAVEVCDTDASHLCPPPVDPATGLGKGRPLGAVRRCLEAEVKKEREGMEAAAAAAGAAGAEGQQDEAEVAADGAEPGSVGGSEGQTAAAAAPGRRLLLQLPRLFLRQPSHPMPELVEKRQLLQAAGGAPGGGGEDQGGEDTSEAAAADTSAGGVTAWEVEFGGRGGGEVGAQTAQQQHPALDRACLAFLDVALPADGYESFLDSLTATALVSQMASIEASLGLKEGTLQRKAENPNSKDTLTLTGWAALVGMFALAGVVLGAAVYVARRYGWLGGEGGHRYTMVVKHEQQQQGQRGGVQGAHEQEMAQQYDARLPARR